MDERRIFEDYNLFYRHLVDAGLAPKTISIRLTGVKSFFTKFYIELPKVGTKTKIKPLKRHEDIPEKEDIQEALKVCNPLQAAIMLTGISSGLAAEDITEITIEGFNKGYDKETEICTLKAETKKRNWFCNVPVTGMHAGHKTLSWI